MPLDRRIQDLFGLDLPIVQAPMAGAMGADMVVAVSQAGGLGSLPCAMLSVEQMRAELSSIRAKTTKPINLNFFCHSAPDAALEETLWKRALEPYYVEFGLDPREPAPAASRAPFDDAACEVVEAFRPEVVSFHFGLPDARLMARVRASGAKIISSATTVDEARWLEERGCDAVIAQGFEGGGHRAMFLASDVGAQVGLMALLPQVVDNVKIPVIAAGGVADGRGVAAAFALGASAVQVGTAYLLCPEARISDVHRDALQRAKESDTTLTNLFSGRPARGVVNRLIRDMGPMSPLAPPFPLASGPLAPLRKQAEAMGSGDFSPLWSGQAAALARVVPAGELTRRLASDAAALLARMASRG
jgi:nitronate monooxygenase